MIGSISIGDLVIWRSGDREYEKPNSQKAKQLDIRKNGPRFRLFGFLAFWLCLVGCRQEVALGPPDILYGQEECVHCSMIISEERYACAVVIEGPASEGEQRRSAAFDDINCMSHYEESLERGERVVARYVHDHESLAWIPAGDTTYLASDALHTPMAAGMAAFASRAAAENAQKQHAQSELLSFVAMRARFVRATSSSSPPSVRKEEP